MQVVVDLRECVWLVARSNKLNKMRVIAASLSRLFPLVRWGCGPAEPSPRFYRARVLNKSEGGGEKGGGSGVRFMGLVAAAACARRRAGEKQLSEQGLITAMAMTL